MTDFPRRLVALRKLRGLSVVELASRVGASRNTLGNWEAGRTEPNVSQLLALAGALQCLASELLPEE